MILHEYKIFNAEVLFREDCTADELIDVISANRVYLPCLYVYNKIDQISIEEVDRIARKPNSIVVRYYNPMILSTEHSFLMPIYLLLLDVSAAIIY